MSAPSESEIVVTSLILSDGVIVERGTNKASLIGCFNSLAVPKFPLVYQSFFATVGLTNLAANGVKLALTVRVEVEKTGHVLASVGGQVDIAVQTLPDAPMSPQDIANEFRKMTIDIPLRFANVTFAQPGAYLIVALANNEVMHKRHLIIQQAASKPPINKPS